eukprot:1677897-Amphidinium_carterae.1
MGLQKQLQAMTQIESRSELVTDFQTGLRQLDRTIVLKEQTFSRHKFVTGKNLVKFKRHT